MYPHLEKLDFYYTLFLKTGYFLTGGIYVNIFSRLKYFIRNLSLTDPKSWDRSLWNLIGSQSLSGENVTESTALTYSAVWDAVELISSAIAALPLQLIQGQSTNKRIATDRRLYRVMHSQWNPYMTAKRGRECQISHVLTWGNGYAEIVRNGYDEVVELWPITPNRVKPQMVNGQLIYEIKMTGSSLPDVTLPREKVLHIIGPSYDGFIGYSRIAMARKSIGLGMAMETFGSNFFGNGTNPSMVVSHPGQLKDPTTFRKALTDVYSGLGKSHRLMLLEEGMKVEKYGIPPNDCQFLESRQFHISDVARWFNLPPHKLKDLTKSSFNNIESEDASFIRDRLLPDLVDLEQSYDMQLLSESDRNLSGRGGLYFKHNIKGLMRADTASRTAFYQAMLDRGVFSINEVRELEDMEPIKGGDVHMVQMNMTTLENAGKQQEIKQLPSPERLPKKGNGQDKDAQQEGRP